MILLSLAVRSPSLSCAVGPGGAEVHFKGGGAGLMGSGKIEKPGGGGGGLEALFQTLLGRGALRAGGQWSPFLCTPPFPC